MDRAARSILFSAVIGLLTATSVIGVLQTIPLIAKDATVSVYFTGVASDIQFDPAASQTYIASGRPTLDILSLNLTMDSVSVHRNGAASASGWTVISHASMTLDVLKSTDVTTLIGTGQVPEQNITMVRLYVARAVAVVRDSQGTLSTVSVKVPSAKLEIPLGSVRVAGLLNTDIIADRPHIVVQGNGTVMLTPTLHLDKVSQPD